MTSGRRGRRVFVATTAAALVIGLTAPAASAASVSPKKWAKKFCTTVGDFRDELSVLGDEIVAFADEAESDIVANPTAVFEVIDTMADYSDDGAELASDAAEAVRELAKPKVGGGGTIKDTIDEILGGGLDDLTTSFETAATDFRAIPDQASDPLTAGALFISIGTQLADTLTTALDSIGEAFNSLPDDPSIDPKAILERALSKSAACADF